MLRALTIEVVCALGESRKVRGPQVVTGERDEEFLLGQGVEAIVDQF